jgi:hypothetical protein
MPGRTLTRGELLERVPRKHDGINWHAYAYVERYSLDQTAWADKQLRG